MQNMLISQIPFDQLKSEIIEELFTRISPLFNSRVPSAEKALLTRKETAEYLKISLPTLSSKTYKGEIKCYRVGGIPRYKMTDINESLLLIKTSKNR